MKRILAALLLCLSLPLTAFATPSIAGTPVTENLNNGSGSTITESGYTVESGSNRILLVNVGSEGASGSVATGVTYGGVAMTKAVGVVNGINASSIWYLLEADIPGGANDVVATWSADKTIKQLVTKTMVDAAQQAPVATTSVASTVDPQNTTLSSPTADGLLTDSSTSNLGNTHTVTQGGSGQTLNGSIADATGFTLSTFTSYKTITVSGNQTVGWTGSWNRLPHTLAIWDSVASGGGASPSGEDFFWIMDQ